MNWHGFERRSKPNEGWSNGGSAEGSLSKSKEWWRRRGEGTYAPLPKGTVVTGQHAYGARARRHL